MTELPPTPGILDWDFPRGVASAALMVKFAGEHGVGRDDMLRDSGIDAATLDNPDAQIDARAELAVIRNLVGSLGHLPALGLEVGDRYRVTTFGIFGFACVSSPTLRDAIAFALRYLELSFTFCIPMVEQVDDEIVAALHDQRVPADVRRFLVERDLAAMYRMLCDLLAGPMPLRRIQFGFPAPVYADRFAEVFGVPAEFDAPAHVWRFDVALLDHALPQGNDTTYAMCMAQCRELVARRRARTGIANEVRDQLVHIGGAPAGIDEVASNLNLSTRTLRRRLTDEGTSYRALLDEVRQAIAEEMLTTTPLSVSDVAIRLGYAEASTFIFAFKRWKGVTPAAYQREHRMVVLP